MAVTRTLTARPPTITTDISASFYPMTFTPGQCRWLRQGETSTIQKRFVMSLAGFFPMTTPGSRGLEVMLGTGLGTGLMTTSAGPADPLAGGTGSGPSPATPTSP